MFPIIESCCPSWNKTETKHYLFLSSASFKKMAEFANSLFRIFPSKFTHEITLFLLSLFYQFLAVGFASEHKYSFKYFQIFLLGKSS